MHIHRFGCPALIPRSPYTSTQPVSLLDCREMKSKTKIIGQKDFDIIEKTPLSSSSSASDNITISNRNVPQNNILHENNVPKNDGEKICTDEGEDFFLSQFNGLISLYRGIDSRNFFHLESSSSTGEQTSKLEKLSDKREATKGLLQIPNVFALRRTYIKSVCTGSESSRNCSNNSDRSDDSNVSKEVEEKWTVSSLSTVWDLRHDSDVFIIVADISSSSSALGWGARNVLALIGAHTGSYISCGGPQDNAATSKSLNDGSDVCAPKHSESSSSSSGSGSSNGLASPLVTNIIALRGSVAKRMYACTSNEKAVDFLSGLTDKEIGTSVVPMYHPPFRYFIFHFMRHKLTYFSNTQSHSIYLYSTLSISLSASIPAYLYLCVSLSHRGRHTLSHSFSLCLSFSLSLSLRLSLSLSIYLFVFNSHFSSLFLRCHDALSSCASLSHLSIYSF